MWISKITYSFLYVLLISTISYSSNLPQCLSHINYQTHRLDKENNIFYCFDKYRTTTVQNSCFTNLDNMSSKVVSIKLAEEIRSICFYETTPFKDLNSCMKEVKRFKNTANHDEAIFFCFQEFQNKINQKECLKTAKQLIYPSKKDYLIKYCNSAAY